MKVCKNYEMSEMEHHGKIYENEWCTQNNCPCNQEKCSEVEMVEAHYRATNIKWDTDGEDVDLPEEMDIPAYVTDEEEDCEDISEVISDYISDETGFCHYGFCLEIVKD